MKPATVRTALARFNHQAMRHESMLQAAAPDEPLRWLPAVRAWRYAVVVVASALFAITFAAWLRPNMVFDLANMIFCG